MGISRLLNSSDNTSAVSSRIGEFVFLKSGRLESEGYLAVTSGTITNGATTYPLWAAMYPEFVSGNDIVFPSDVDGMFLRNLGGNSSSEGSFQDSANKAHSHTYNRPPQNQFTGRGTGTNIARRGTNSNVATTSEGGAESRPVNRAYQLYTIIDTYRS